MVYEYGAIWYRQKMHILTFIYGKKLFYIALPIFQINSI